MKAFVKSLKFSYIVYNIFNKKKLKHNIPLFKKYGIRKKYFSSLSGEDFRDVAADHPRTFDEVRLRNTAFFKKQTPENQEGLLRFDEKGFAIIRNFLSPQMVEEINSDIDRLVSTGELGFSYINKLMFAIRKSEAIRRSGDNRELLELLSVLFDGKAKLFQSINFLHGSQQKTHSDSIHMSTFPLGGLMGVWVALEDIDLENGPLHYYPGSHKLPYYSNADYGNRGNFFMLGKKGYGEYERFLRDKLTELSMEKQVFTCKKGDMLIWHANILHGGEPQLDAERTRKSMVFHYFDEDSICYHEISERPALFDS